MPRPQAGDDANQGMMQHQWSRRFGVKDLPKMAF
jgi:hypothetical protein